MGGGTSTGPNYVLYKTNKETREVDVFDLPKTKMFELYESSDSKIPIVTRVRGDQVFQTLIGLSRSRPGFDYIRNIVTAMEVAK